MIDDTSFAAEIRRDADSTEHTLSDADLAAYDTLRSGALMFASSDRWISLVGDKAAEALNGLITNDVTALHPGDGQYAAALTPKGKVIADFTVLRLEANAFLLAVPQAAADGWLALVRKYVNPRLAKVADESDRYVSWMICGAGASATVSRVCDTRDGNQLNAVNIAEQSVWQHALHRVASASVRVIVAPPVAQQHAFVILAETTDRSIVEERLVSAGVRVGSDALRHLLRVESGRPLWGVDMDENTIPQEANLDVLQAISFNKGCYTGQETVARLHFRGHVNRLLRGMRATQSLKRGALVRDESGKDVGDVRSVAQSPRYGAIAIAMIRREIAIGDTVKIGDGEATTSARVVALPFTQDYVVE